MNENIHIQKQNQYIGKIFLYMFIGLILSALTGFLLTTVFLNFFISLVKIPFMLLIVLLLQLFVVWKLRPDPERLKNSKEYKVRFALYSILNGFTFALIGLVYTTASIVMAFISTSALFGILTIFAYTSKKDFSNWKNILYPSLLALIIVSFINIFLNNNILSTIISIATLIVFIFLTIYDIQKIKMMFQSFYNDEEEVLDSIAVMMALEVYLDFVNIFLSILRLFGNTRD